MATKKTDPAKEEGSKEEITQENILKHLEPLAGVMKKTAGQVWKITVLRYVAKGVAEVFTSILIAAVSLRLLGSTTLWLFVPAGVIALLIYDAIQLLIDPGFYALKDAIDFIQEERKTSSSSNVTIYNK